MGGTCNTVRKMRNDYRILVCKSQDPVACEMQG
jgi:hypothetical protein